MPMFFYQRKFSQQTSELRTIVMAGIHNIMSTTSSCQPQHVVVGKWTSPRVKKISGAKLCVSNGHFRASIGESSWQKWGDCSESSFCTSKSQTIDSCGKILEDDNEDGKMRTRLYSESSIAKKKLEKTKDVTFGGSLGFMWSSPHCWRCANVSKFGATLRLCGFASCYNKTQWYGCTQQLSVNEVTTLLPCGIAAGAW